MQNDTESLVKKRDSLLKEYKELKKILKESEQAMESTIIKVKSETSQLKQVFLNTMPQIQSRIREKSCKSLSTLNTIECKDNEAQTEETHHLQTHRDTIDDEISELINLQLITEVETEDLNSEFESLVQSKNQLDFQLKQTQKSLVTKQQQIGWLEQEHSLLLQHISREDGSISIPAYMKYYLNSNI
jgi:hypothetical protein